MPIEQAPQDAADVAVLLAAALDDEGCEYAIGGAIALGFWAEPRGTLDVDVTLYTDPQSPTACIEVLRRMGSEFEQTTAHASLAEHGYCRVVFHGWRVDVFMPIADFYEIAKSRRKLAPLVNGQIYIWDAETLCVFKMMFFRRKDLADVEQLLRSQGNQLEVSWVDRCIEQMFGKYDPRLGTWREIVAEVRASEA